MNAFMVWSKERRKALAQDYPRLKNKVISKILGSEWKALNEVEKKPFFDKAKEIWDRHKEEHPDYIYRPRRKPKNRIKRVDMPNASLPHVQHAHSLCRTSKSVPPSCSSATSADFHLVAGSNSCSELCCGSARDYSVGYHQS